MSITNRFFIYLSPSIMIAGISFALIPLTTARLDPADFGLFALMSIFGSIITSFSSLGSSYIWAAKFHELDEFHRTPFISTMALSSLIAALFWSFLFWLLFITFRLPIELIGNGSRFYFAVILISSSLTFIWIHAQEYLILESLAHAYAMIVTAAAVISAIVTLFSLYVMSTGVAALFWSHLANSVVLSVGALWVLRRHLRLQIDTGWVRILWTKGIPTMPGNILESGATAVERNVLNASLSLSALGVYSHSQRYRGLCQSLLKALARSIWPVSLSEARQGSRDFSLTRRAWSPLIFLIALFGIISGAVGKETIALLTHDKFTVTAPYVTAWMMFIAVQNAGKEHTAVLYTNNQGIFLTYAQVACQILFIVLLFLLIPIIGLWGAMVANIAQMVIFRILVQWKTAQLQYVPFNDYPIVLCILFTGISLAIQILYWDNIYARMMLSTGLLITYFVLERDVSHIISERARAYYRSVRY